MYSDDSNEDVSDAVTASPASGTMIYEDTTKITFSWTWPDDETVALTSDVAVKVTRVLSSIGVSAPTKTTYYKGDALNLSGAVVTATFNSGRTAVVTSSATFSPENGSTLSSFGAQTVTASYTENGVTKTATTSVTVTVKTVTWASGTDTEIADMVEAADAGIISLYDYWTVGDVRSIKLSAMSATGVGESHAAQTQEFVLMNKGGKTLENGKTCSFVVGMVRVLSTSSSYESGYMNSSSTNSGGWESCARRTWCNSVFRNAIPPVIRGIFKQFKNVTANGSSSSVKTSTDYFALPSEKEVFGSATHANSSAESSNSQFEYYKTSSNRVKASLDGVARSWWERSPYSGNSYNFCYVNSNGNANYIGAHYDYGIAPFGCI
nr:DUF6273 domain-containing protein [uncultured Eubacterium sp.]